MVVKKRPGWKISDSPYPCQICGKSSALLVFVNDQYDSEYLVLCDGHARQIGHALASQEPRGQEGA